MWAALQHAGWVEALATSRPLFGLVLVVHYSATFLCVGTIVLLDLRILGVAARTNALSALAGQFRRWIWIGCGALLVSGFLLFTVLAGSYAVAAPFQLKMLVVVLAIISGLSIERMVPAWDRAAVMPLTARLAALLSIALWLGAILVSVEIPALTGLG
jgi:hypothetical protein